MYRSPVKYFIVDAFANRPFQGNPASVVLLDTWRDDSWLQNVAMEMNLSETAFLVGEGSEYALRWFTPTIEVDLCGHATLAAAKVLAHMNRLADGASVAFSTRSGRLDVLRTGERFEMNFPVEIQEPVEAPLGLIDSLEVKPLYVGRNRFDYLIEVESESIVRSLAPIFNLLAKVQCRGVIVTARSDSPEFDFVSRFFAPAAGINEDPVTGSAHCCLAEFWGKRLGKNKLQGFQASQRGGQVEMQIVDQRVLLGGSAVIVAEGTLTLD